MGKKSRERKQRLEREEARQAEQVGAEPTAECSDPAGERERMKRDAYRKKLAGLQVQMMGLQEWIAGESIRAIVLLEGLGPAGKRATAQHIAGGLPGKFCEVLTLEPPDKRARERWHFQRFVEHFPSAGRLVIFDGSWYHQPAIDRALGLTGEQEFVDFLHACAEFEQALAASGVALLKYWFTADDEEQDRRFRDHIAGLVKDKQLKLPDQTPQEAAPVANVLQTVLACTDIPAAHWHVIPADDKRRARLCCMEHLLAVVPSPSSGNNEETPAEGS